MAFRNHSCRATAILLSVALGAAAALPVEADALEVDLRLTPKDLSSQEVIEVDVKVTLEPVGHAEAKSSQTTYVVKKSGDDLESLSVAEIVITADEQRWHQRRVRWVRGPEDLASFKRDQVLYLVPKDEPPDHGKSIRVARGMVGARHVDYALSYFSFAASALAEQPESVTPALRDNIIWNHAMSLVNACVKGYDTCEDAKRACGALTEQIESKPDLSRRMAAEQNVSLKEVDRCRRMVADVEVRHHWAEVRKAFARATDLLKKNRCDPRAEEEYFKTARLIEEARQSFKMDKARWVANRVFLFAINRDEGVAYLSAADLSRKCRGEDDQTKCTLWAKAQHFLQQALEENDPDPATPRNLQLIAQKQKLNECPRA